MSRISKILKINLKFPYTIGFLQIPLCCRKDNVLIRVFGKNATSLIANSLKMRNSAFCLNLLYTAESVQLYFCVFAVYDKLNLAQSRKMQSFTPAFSPKTINTIRKCAAMKTTKVSMHFFGGSAQL